MEKDILPPVSGNIAATSALLNAPNNVIQPATIQTLNNNKGEPNFEAMSEGFIKIPEPTMPPITMAIVVLKFKVRSKSAIQYK